MTLSSRVCHPALGCNRVTIQDTMGVDDVSPIEAEWISIRRVAVLEDMPVAAFKIVCGNIEQIAAIAEVGSISEVPLVLDPVARFGPRRRLSPRRW